MARMLFALTAAAVLGFAMTIPAGAQSMSFRADLKAGNEGPPSANGTLTATYDPATKQLSWQGNVSGLSGNATAAHFHGPAAHGQNAGVLVPAPGVTTGAFQGSATLTDEQAKYLTDGQTYFNIHTQAHPAGEVRGQVLKAQ